MQKMPQHPFQAALNCYSLLKNPRINDGKIRATLEGSPQIDELCKLFPCFNFEADQHEIEWIRPKNFFLDMADFLQAADRRKKLPSTAYCIASLSYISTCLENPPEIIEYYRSAVALYQLLSATSALQYPRGNGEHLVMLGVSKLEITDEYSEEDLRVLAELDEFRRDFIESEGHAVQKKEIVLTSLLKTFEGRSSATFGEVLKKFAELLDRVKAAYALYSAEFSYEKISQGVKKDALDAVVKINKVFSDIQNQMLAIPAAQILVGSSIKANTGILGNLLVLLGALIAVFVVYMLTANQLHTLGAIKRELDSQKETIEKGCTEEIKERLYSEYLFAYERLTSQKTQVLCVRWLAYAMGMLSTFYFAFVTFNSSITY